MADKLKQIEDALRAIGPAAFQALCDAYLHRKGYEAINPLGRVPGRDQVAPGTPDTWIAEPDGRFVFAEYTTQLEGLLAKVRSDLQKCADESKTGIPRSKIREVVYCHTSVPSVADHLAMMNTAQELGLVLTVLGLGQISQDLYQKYPGLARDFLGVEVDTGQILTPDEYAAAYGKSSLATPLDTEFQFRDEEVKELVEALERRRIVILSGPMGTGKSRLALEGMRRLHEAYPNLVLRCIYNRGANLFEDVRTHFAEPGDYLILVDDANRISGFDYVLQLLHEDRPDRTIRILATVRDYAVGKVRDAVLPYGGAAEIMVGLLTGEQVRQLAERTYGIRHGLFLSRIEEIAAGNARLAMMASRLAREEDSFESILNAAELYHAYYKGVRSELDELGHSEVRRAAGIITLFRVVDRSNTEQMEQIATTFGVAPDAFWEAVKSLHAIELVDLYENEVVKIADQILGTYLFYLAVFDSGEIELAKVLENLFPAHRHRIIDALNGVVRAFGSEATFEPLRDSVDHVWMVWKSSGEQERLLDLMHTFWFVRPNETLLYASEQIQALEPEPRGEISFEYKNTGTSGDRTLVGLLGAFHSGTIEEMRIALNLLLDYAALRSTDLPSVQKTLTERFGFQKFSQLEGFKREALVVEVLQERARSSADPLVAEILAAVTAEFLKTEFHRVESGSGRAITMINFTFGETDALRRVRDTLLEGLFWLWRNEYKESVIRVLEQYASAHGSFPDPEIATGDAKQLLGFFAEFPSDGIRECILVHDYLDQLDRAKISYDEALRVQFTCSASTLADLLLVDRREVRGLSWEQRSERFGARVKAFFHEFSDEAWANALRDAESLLNLLKDDHSRYQIRSGISVALATLAAEDGPKYLRVLGAYLEAGEYLILSERQIVRWLREQLGPGASLEFVRAREFPAQRRWFSTLFASFDQAHITPEIATALLNHVQQVTPSEMTHDLEFLEAYRATDAEIVVKVVKTLTEKATHAPAIAESLASLFNRYGQMSARLPEIFANQQDLLERAYLLAAAHDAHMDHDGKSFALVTDMNPSFPLRYLQHRMKPVDDDVWKRFDNSGDRHRFAQLWGRDDYDGLMRPLFDHAYQVEKEHYFMHDALHVLLSLPEEVDEDPQPWQDGDRASRQDYFLQRLIRERAEDPSFIAYLFAAIARMQADRRREMIKAYLATSPSVEDFRRIALEPRSLTAWGSWVPYYQRQLDFVESLLPLFDRPELLKHRAYIEERIEHLRKQIRNEKRSDFFDG